MKLQNNTSSEENSVPSIDRKTRKSQQFKHTYELPKTKESLKNMMQNWMEADSELSLPVLETGKSDESGISPQHSQFYHKSKEYGSQNKMVAKTSTVSFGELNEIGEIDSKSDKADHLSEEDSLSSSENSTLYDV